MNIRDKVLLVEDERTIRSFMQAILTANGYDVLMAGTGAMANTMIASHCPDIIILDLGLPDMDGMTILRNVRKWSKVPILVVSARSHERDKVEALDAGADDYLTKPFGTEELLARIRAQNRLIRQQEETLGQTRRDFAAITENMGESFLLLDKRLNVLSRNVSASYLLPAPPDGEADNLNRGGCPEEIVRAAERALAGRRTELTLEMHERYYYVIATPVFSENQITGSVVIALDTTEREQREALRREFSANVSHELKTPLTSISGFAELLANGMVPPERVGEFAGDIYKESQRLMALVDDIIELSRLEEETAAPETESVDLYALAEETLASLRPAAERRDVTLTLRGGEAVVQGVRTALQELVYNLCDNAVKYNRPGGSVTVTAEKRGGETVLSVADTGIGIPYEHQNRVFERFYRVDKSHSRQLGGTGLGLSIVKHAAAMHKARLELWSEPDAGTKITVHFDGQ